MHYLQLLVCYLQVIEKILLFHSPHPQNTNPRGFKQLTLYRSAMRSFPLSHSQRSLSHCSNHSVLNYTRFPPLPSPRPISCDGPLSQGARCLGRQRWIGCFYFHDIEAYGGQGGCKGPLSSSTPSGFPPGLQFTEI